MIFARVENDDTEGRVTSVYGSHSHSTEVDGKAKESPSHMWVNLSSLPFLAAWFAIVALHVLCGVSLIVTALIYVFVTNPNMIFWAKLLGGAENPYFKISSIVMTIVGILHLQQVFWIVLASFRDKELVFRCKSHTGTSRIQSMCTRVRSVIESRKLLKKMHRTVNLFTLFGLKLIERKGVLGVESKFFPVVFTVREILEVASQTYQANQSYNYIPRPWINHVVMTLLLINCWSTPILQHFLQGHPAVVRIACLMTDALLILALVL